jgi:2-desacetyl-2-hydroxyethyl bacteriochlorophyllide A dehydrogenase
MKRRTVYFAAPRLVEFREETLPRLGADDVLVETICSAISAGTEMLVYQGRFPRDLETDSAISSLRGGFEYPLAYGYACVGQVKDVGKSVNGNWIGRLVFAFQPHTSHFITKPEALIAIPQLLSPETACFLPNMETAVNLVQDGAPILGERVMVFGQGVVGLLTASLLGEFPLECLVVADCYERRRAAFDIARASFKISHCASVDPNDSEFRSKVFAASGFSFTDTGAASSGWPQTKFDLVYELSGNPAALNEAISLTCFSGRIVIGSWYGEKKMPIDLGGSFHRSRIKMISSQVSTITPELSARWDKSRRFDVAWKALERIKPEKWITHRFSIKDADKAYQLLDENPQETIQILFEY